MVCCDLPLTYSLWGFVSPSQVNVLRSSLHEVRLRHCQGSNDGIRHRRPELLSRRKMPFELLTQMRHYIVRIAKKNDLSQTNRWEGFSVIVQERAKSPQNKPTSGLICRTGVLLIKICSSENKSPLISFVNISHLGYRVRQLSY